MRKSSSEKTVQATTTLTTKDYQAIKKLSAKTGEPIASIMRKHILEGMSLEKSKDDIDFICKQLRDELEIAFERRMNRIIKLLIKIGSICYPLAYYNTMLGAALSTGHDLNYHEMFADAKRDGARYLGVADGAVDLAFEEMMRFDDE